MVEYYTAFEKSTGHVLGFGLYHTHHIDCVGRFGVPVCYLRAVGSLHF